MAKFVSSLTSNVKENRRSLAVIRKKLRAAGLSVEEIKAAGTELDSLNRLLVKVQKQGKNFTGSISSAVKATTRGKGGRFTKTKTKGLLANLLKEQNRQPISTVVKKLKQLGATAEELAEAGSNRNALQNLFKKYGGPLDKLKSVSGNLSKSVSSLTTGNVVSKALSQPAKKLSQPAKKLSLLKKAGKFLGTTGGKVAVGSSVLSALFLGSSISKTIKNTKLARRLDQVETSSAEDVLKRIARSERLAMREGQLAQRNPAAYQSLTNIASGQGLTPALARGEFVIGGTPPSGRILQSNEVQDILAALTGE